jgi:hypothetical protein
MRDATSELIRTFPATEGLRVSHIDALIRIHNRILHAMIGAENVLARQHPDANGEAMRIMHGTDWSTWAPCSGRNRRHPPKLTREQWIDWGRKLKAIHDEAVRLFGVFLDTQGATKPYLRRFFTIQKATSNAKVRFDALVYKQHPDWEGFTRAFYGPDITDRRVTPR